MTGFVSKLRAFFTRQVKAGRCGNEAARPRGGRRTSKTASADEGRTSSPLQRIEEARRDAQAAANAIARISARYLRDFLALPPRLRLPHLGDPALTPSDKSELERSVRSALPSSSILRLPRWKLTNLVRGLWPSCGYECIVTFVLLIAGGLLTATAWNNTGSRIVGSDNAWPVDWTLPDGTLLT